MRFSVLLPERLAGWMRLRWLSSNCDSCITNRVQYKNDADKLSPEKRFYYERFKALLQAIKAIKINKFGKNHVLIGQSVKQVVFYNDIFIAHISVLSVYFDKNYDSNTQSDYWCLPEIC